MVVFEMRHDHVVTLSKNARLMRQQCYSEDDASLAGCSSYRSTCTTDVRSPSGVVDLKSKYSKIIVRRSGRRWCRRFLVGMVLGDVGR